MSRDDKIEDFKNRLAIAEADAFRTKLIAKHQQRFLRWVQLRWVSGQMRTTHGVDTLRAELEEQEKTHVEIAETMIEARQVRLARRDLEMRE